MELEFVNDGICYVVSEVELVYRSKVRPAQRPVVKDSKQAFSILLETWDESVIDLREEFKIMLLDTRSKVLGIYTGSTGGISQTTVDIRLLFAAALKAVASSIIIVHNHPSGDLKPSKADEVITQKIRQAGDILTIPLRDHLIITREAYFSFADAGLLQ